MASIQQSIQIQVDASADDTRTGTTSGSGMALTGGGMRGGRDAGTSGKGSSS